MPTAVSKHLAEHIDMLTLPVVAYEIVANPTRTDSVMAQLGKGRKEAITHLFDNHLATLRCMAGRLTQKQLADALGMSSQQVSNWETGSSNPAFVTKSAAVEVCLAKAREDAANDLTQALRANAQSADAKEAEHVFAVLESIGQYLFPRSASALDRVLRERELAYERTHPKPTKAGEDELFRHAPEH